MIRKDIDKILAADLGAEFAREGFRYEKTTKRLKKDLGDISQSIGWSYYSRFPGSVVSPMLGVRSEAIFAIFKQVTPINKNDEKFHRALSVDIWRLFGDRSRGEFKVTSDEEAHRAAASIAALIHSYGLPFFEKYSSLADIDRLFNAKPNAPEARLFSLDNWTRIGNALIAARLADNPKYNELIEIYRKSLAEFSGGEYVESYERLVVLLSGLNQK
jgi:hypothetical protein